MNSGVFRGLFFRTLVLFAIWLMLSESVAGLPMLLGLLVALGIALLNPDRSLSRPVRVNWLRLLAYLPWLLGRVFLSGVHMSWLILHPALPIDPKMVRYEPRLRSNAGLVLLANSITLTPGTISVELGSDGLLVHTIDDSSADDLVSQRMEDRILGIFGGHP